MHSRPDRETMIRRILRSRISGLVILHSLRDLNTLILRVRMRMRIRMSVHGVLVTIILTKPSSSMSLV